MDIFSLLDQIQAVARNGLYYSDNGYDSERYKRILNLSAEQYSELLDTSSTEIKQNFLAETGQITPKVGADAAIFDEAGRILLMERVDGTGWCLPCGWVEAGEKPCQAAIRETKEEDGFRCNHLSTCGCLYALAPSARRSTYDDSGGSSLRDCRWLIRIIP